MPGAVTRRERDTRHDIPLPHFQKGRTDERKAVFRPENHAN